MEQLLLALSFGHNESKHNESVAYETDFHPRMAMFTDFRRIKFGVTISFLKTLILSFLICLEP